MRYIKYASLFFLVPIVWLFPHSESDIHVLFAYRERLEHTEDSAIIHLSKYGNDGNYTIKDTINLNGKTWFIPKNISITFDGGLIRNGEIRGNNTKVFCKGAVFDKVHISGSWKVPEISTSMFTDLSYDNSLKDVFALANPKIKNNIYIDYGNYYVSALKNFDHCLNIASNTEITINGNIILLPNIFEEYSVLFVNGDSISIKGDGTIFGDKHTHLGRNGEWGMGVSIYESQNIRIEKIAVKDCWGDCIYISGDSKDIVIDECFLDHGRRQGISITSAENILINNCIISNVGGKAPQYAIDVEPNSGGKVNAIRISNVKTINCYGGIMVYGWAEKAEVGTVELINCIIEGAVQCPIYFQKGRNALVENCRIFNCNSTFMIVCNDIDSVRIENNSISRSNQSLSSDKAIAVNRARIKNVKNNLFN